MQLLREVQAKGESRISRLEGTFVTLFNTVSKLSDTVSELAKSQRNVIESQVGTDERLNSLINVVERYVSQGRNGKPRS